MNKAWKTTVSVSASVSHVFPYMKFLLPYIVKLIPYTEIYGTVFSSLLRCDNRIWQIRIQKDGKINGGERF